MLLTVCALLLAQAQPSEAAPSGVPGMAPVPGVPSLLQSGVPEVPRGLRERLDQYQNARAAALLDVLPDGSAALIATRFASTNQLHVVEHPMGARQQLTFGEEPISRGHLAPDGRSVYYLRDVGGGEFFQVYRLDRRSGRSELLTDGKSRHQSLLLSHDGSGIAWASTARNGKDHDVYAGTTSSPKKVRRLTEREGSWEPADFSYDGKKLLVVQERAVDDADLHVVDLTTGEMRQLTPKEGKGSVAGAAFAPDGKSVYVATDRYGDFNAVWRIDLARIGEAPASTPFGRGQKWDVEDFAISPDGKLLAASINEDGWSRIYLAPANGGTPQALPLPKGLGGVLKFPEKRSDVLFIAQQTARSPTDVWSIDLKTKKPVRWTKSEVGGLDTDSFVEPELVRYPGKGGVSVPAFLWKPRTGGRVPVVIVWHGGPEGQSRPSFTPSSQFLANEMGIAVLAPNVRGSTGYGKAYVAMDNGVRREEALTDIGATLDFIASRPDLDKDRVAVWGGSYGGYMVLASVAFYGERIRAGVDVVGISNLVSFLKNTQAYRQDLRRVEYGDERDPAVRAVQERISPLNSVEKIKSSLFVVQGHNDPRVPQSEAEQIVKAVRGRGGGAGSARDGRSAAGAEHPVDVWYLLGLNEGHGFQKKENRDYYTAATMWFLEQELKPRGAPPG
ncbi:MAG: S9 family peptidase [Myxococcales bacterium]